jgi:hypothetical protein
MHDGQSAALHRVLKVDALLGLPIHDQRRRLAGGVHAAGLPAAGFVGGRGLGAGRRGAAEALGESDDGEEREQDPHGRVIHESGVRR